MKSRTGQHTCESWSGLHFASLNQIKSRQFLPRDGKSRTRLDVFQQRYCVSAKAYFFFFLAVFFFAFFAFLAMVSSVVPKLSRMQVERRPADDSVHHNRRIDTACFEQGKRRSHHCECTIVSRNALARAHGT